MDQPHESQQTDAGIPSPPPLEKPVWNFWWTLLWGITLILIWQLVQAIGVVIYMISEGIFGEYISSKGKMSEQELMDRIMDGDLIGIISFVSIFAVCPAAWLIGKIKKPWGGMEYLGHRSVKWWSWPMWLIITFVLMMAMNTLGPMLGLDEMHDSMITMAQSTDYPILLFLGIAVGAPFVEEFIFRGVLWTGWRKSRLGLWGTIALTTIFWSLLHIQYMNEPSIFLFLGAFGILLGLAREYTGSIWVPVAMHALNNGISAIAMLTTELPA